MIKKNLLNSLILVFLVVAVTGYEICRERSFLMQLSLSSDGHYLVSSHHGPYLMLWDLEKKRKKIISRDVNIFSVYFIPDTSYFMWQRLSNNDVVIQTVDGKIIKTFNPGFPVYGHLMKKDLKTYISSDIDWSLYYLDKNKVMRFQEDHGGYYGGMKLFGFKTADNYLLTSGVAGYKGEKTPIAEGNNFRDIMEMKIPDRLNKSLFRGVTLWDLNDYKPIKKLYGNMFKTDADISLNGKHVVAGDETGFVYLWDIDHGKRTLMDEPTNSHLNCFHDQQCWENLRKELQEKVKTPEDFYVDGVNGNYNMAIRFIDENKHILRFLMENKYAILYSVESPEIVSFIDLGHDPKPQAFYYADANNVVTAPKAKILVMGQNFMHNVPISKGTGIIVYKFDEQQQTLKRVWVADGPSWHWKWKNFLGIFTV